MGDTVVIVTSMSMNSLHSLGTSWKLLGTKQDNPLFTVFRSDGLTNQV